MAWFRAPVAMRPAAGFRAVVLGLLLAWSATAAAQTPPAYHYAGNLRIEPDTGRLTADWRITLRDPEPATRTFVLRDTLGAVSVGGDVAEASVAPAEGMEGFQAVTVTLDPDIPSPVVEMSYAGVPIPERMDNDINGIEPGRVELNVDSFWFPIDRRFNQLLSAELDLAVAGAGWQGVSTGTVTPTSAGFHIVNEDPRLDIAFTLSTHFRITRAEGFTLYDQRDTNAGIEELARTASFCRRFLNERWGRAEPLPASRLLVTRRETGGYARKNYIAFTNISDVAAGDLPRLTRFVCHEFAHTWAAGAAFNTVDNWINEGFAELLGLMGVRERHGQEAYRKLLETMREALDGETLPPIWTPGATERGPYLVNYRKAPLALARLEKHIGRDLFMAFTQAVLAQPVKTTPALLDSLEAVAGAPARAWFEDRLAE